VSTPSGSSDKKIEGSKIFNQKRGVDKGAPMDNLTKCVIMNHVRNFLNLE
jgi:hypothetical protein